MNINIKLLQANGKIDNREPFIIADNELLTLSFESKVKYDKYHIALRNGNTVEKHITTDKLTLPQSLMTAGLLEVEVTAIVKGNPVKQWAIEPITLIEIDCGFKGHPAFDEMIRLQKEQADKLEELDKRFTKAFEGYEFFRK